MMRMVMALMTLLELAADAAAFRSVVTCAYASLDDEQLNIMEMKRKMPITRAAAEALRARC